MRLLLACLSVLVTVWTQEASAQASGPLRLVVPFPAGGGTDVIARFIGNELAARINQNVVVVNQTGANGYIATQAVQTSPPDGNTLLLATTNQAIFPATKRDLPFHVVEGFESVMLLCAGPLVFVSNQNFPHKTIPQIIAAAKAEPGKINYASSGGIGNVTHLAAELLSQKAAIEMVHVPYRGAAPAIVDVISGAVPFTISTISSALPYFESKTLVPIAQTPKTRASVAPNIPTVAEQTGLDYDLTYWIGFLAPPKTPKDRIAFLQKALAEIAATPKAQEFIKTQGFDPKPGTPEDFTKFLYAETKLWVEIAKAAKLAPE